MFYANWPETCGDHCDMSNPINNDNGNNAGEVVVSAPESALATRRRALKGLLGAAPMVLTFPSVTAAAASLSCVTKLKNVVPRPAPIINANDPTWVRAVVRYQSWNDHQHLYAYHTGTTMWFYDGEYPHARLSTDNPPFGYTQIHHESLRYVLVDISKTPIEPDFTGTGVNSSMSCMASVSPR